MKRFLFLAAAVAFVQVGCVFGNSPEPLALGASAPVVKGIDQDGAEFDLGALYEDAIVLVYFYPKASTPG
jgi:cytochrome oxidase Cu insertion factor (SCO1/SenC/PrrC family)